MLRDSVILAIADFELAEVRLGKPMMAVVRGRDKENGIEVELKVPITLKVRSDRRPDPTFKEIKIEAESSIGRLCLKMAWALNKSAVIARVSQHQDFERKKQNKVGTSSSAKHN